MSPARYNLSRTLRLAEWLSVLLAIPLLGAGCGRFSLPGIGGAKAQAQAEDEPATVAVTDFSDKLELFMEHPYLVQGEGAKFNVHLTVLEDGMPIRSGVLTVVAKGPSGKTATVEQAAPRSPGIYGPTVAFPEAGQNQITLALKSDQAADTIRVLVTVYPNKAAATRAAESADEAEPEGAIPFLKEQQWKIGLVTEPVAKRRLVERLVVPGEISPAAGAKAVVTPPIAGRVLPPPGGVFPRVGQEVRAGQVVAVIEPPLAGPSGVALLANRVQVQTLETELTVRQMGVEVEIQQAKLELEHVRGVYDRVKGLGSANAISKKELDKAEHEFRLAETDYDGKLRLRRPYEEARSKLKAMLTPAGPASAADWRPDTAQPSAMQVVMKAPHAGTVTDAQATEGEYVDVTRALFTVINLDRVWVEARVSEFDLDRVVKAPAAEFTLAAHPGRRFSILGADGGTLIDVGSVVDPESRTVPVRYQVGNPGHTLRIGLFADVAIETARAEQAPAIPESAIVDEDGRSVAYVMLDGESFQKRDLDLGLRDGGFVQVKQGLKEGERVATKGAYAIRLASVSAVIPAHGHAH